MALCFIALHVSLYRTFVLFNAYFENLSYTKDASMCSPLTITDIKFDDCITFKCLSKI